MSAGGALGDALVARAWRNRQNGSMEVAGKRATPVDYKRGVAPDLPQGAYDPERVQLCLQGLILRDNGYECDSGVLYFAASKTRVEIPFDDELVRLTRESVEGLRKLGEGGRMPPPLVDSAKCVRCSLAGICLPDEVNRLAHPELPAETRRLVPARDDRIRSTCRRRAAPSASATSG